MTTSPPESLTYRRTSRVLEVGFGPDRQYTLSAEYLRVYSPSAEVRGHGAGPMKLVAGKESVSISNIEPVGHYAVKLTFDDGHDSGLYTWQTLYELGRDKHANWADYLARLDAAGLSRHVEGGNSQVQHYKPADDNEPRQ